VAQKNKVDGVNVTSITVVASIDPEILENLIDTEKIGADLVDGCTDKSVMEYLEYMQERSASVTAEYVNAVVLAKVSFTMPGKGLALRVTKAVADYCLFCRPDQCIFTNSYVDDNSCLISEYLASYFITMTSHRDIYIYLC
jgi:hypothetical protein